MITFQQALQQLTKEALQPLYFLIGTEYYFVEQFRFALEKKVGEESDDINAFDLRETAIQDVIIDLETLPFFTERNVTIVEYPYFLRATNEKVAVSHDLAMFEKYIEHPAPFSTLIIIAPYESVDKRKKLTKLLMKNAVTIDCQPMKGKALRKWLRQIVNAQRITMTEEAMVRMEAEFGANLFLLQSEIAKMAQYVGENGQIDGVNLLDIMSSSVEQTAIELADAVLQKDLHKAITIYKQLEKMNEDPIGMIALLAYQFRTILQVKLFANKGYPLQHIQSNMKVHPFVVKKAYERMRQYKSETLYYIMNELTETDYKIKRGEIDKGIAFELLMYRLIAV